MLHDHVRVLKRKQIFDRGYQVKYSLIVYTIEKIDGLWYVLNNGKQYREGDLQRISAPKAVVEDKSPEVAPIIDVRAAAVEEHKVENHLKFNEGVDQTNRRSGLRERKPSAMSVDERYGRVLW